MSRISKRPMVLMPTEEEDKAITAAAKSDPDAQPLTPKQLKAMVPSRALRGRPKSEKKKLLVSVRYSPEVLAAERKLRIAGAPGCKVTRATGRDRWRRGGTRGALAHGAPRKRSHRS